MERLTNGLGGAVGGPPLPGRGGTGGEWEADATGACNVADGVVTGFPGGCLGLAYNGGWREKWSCITSSNALILHPYRIWTIVSRDGMKV